MNKPPMIKQIANYVYEKFAKHPGDFLLISGIIGWAASCANQTVAIIINKKIPKEQKYFLIPQEITDGIVNTILFAFFTRSFTRFGERFVEQGKWATKEIVAKLKQHALDTKVGQKGFNLLEVPQLNELDPKFDKEFSESYHKFANGISFVFSTLGSIVSCNFVTPVVRNKIAANRQKKALARDKELLDLQKAHTPILPAQNDITAPEKDKPETKLAYYTSNPYSLNGRMKI